MTQRRDLLKLAALGGGAVFVSGLAGCAAANGGGANQDFYFVQLSDTHWGFSGPPNPDAQNTLRRAVNAVNALESKPDFIVFTGDLTHTTDDPGERRKRMTQFREIVSALKVKQVRFMPGEHDASLDRGAAYANCLATPSIRSTTRACTSSLSTMFPTPARASAKSSWRG